ncbi:MAG TPA: DNA recombination protein RmuC [Gaiellaceae bacterium]|nr:DNA recombination protein RmuC [Gaiellaceae bacterium]
MVILALITGLLLGGACAWLVSRSRTTQLETELELRRRAGEERLAVVTEARDAFRALSSEALQQTTSSFLEVAKTQISGHVAPLKDSLERMDRQMSGMEKVRQEAYGAVTQHLTTLAGTHEQLRLETGNLVKALRTPHVRGRWGEVQLRNVVEAAGMLPHCDFQEQASTRDSHGSLLRPDLVVRIPGGKHVVVDAKAPLAAYLDACECDDDDLRIVHLQNHARQVREHLGKLSQKSYWRQFEPSPDFVIMFVPDETFIRVAQEHDAMLSEDGWKAGVILSSPSTLFTLLRTVAATWQQETVAQSAREVHELGRELYGRISTMAKHLGDAGKALDNAVGHYNSAVGSLETRVLVQARRFEQHGIEGAIPSPQPIERQTRPLQAPELVEPGEQLRAIDAA